MGVVIKQGFYNSVWMAVGLAIGYVNMVLLFPVFLTADQFGLTRVLWAAGTVFGQFALLGSPQVLMKFFPQFGNKPKQKGGFFMFMLFIALVGFLLFLLAGFIFKGQIINTYANQSKLFGDNYNYIYVLTFFFIFFNVLEAQLRAALKTTVASFLKNTVIRVIWLALIVLYQKKLISFETFIFWYVSAYAVILLILVVYAISIGQLTLSFRMNFLTARQMKNMGLFGLYVILSSSTAYLANYLDVLMVGGMIDLKSVAFYSVAFYLGSVILLPFNGTSTILIPIISESFSKNNLSRVKEIYQSASVNLSLASMLIFLGIWLNADNIFRLLPPSYSSGKYVLLFIALTKLLSASLAVSVFVLQYSKYFKQVFWFNITFLIVVVVSNYFLIPPLGIVGAALATFLAQIFILTINVLFVYSRIKILPFKSGTLKILILGGLVYGAVCFIPQFHNILLDILLRSFIILVIYLPLAYFWKVSDEYSGFVLKYLRMASHLIGIK